MECHGWDMQRIPLFYLNHDDDVKVHGSQEASSFFSTATLQSRDEVLERL